VRTLSKLLYPEKFYSSIFEIDLEELRKEKITGIIIDLDNTLVAWDKRETTEELHRWLDEVRERGFKLCIVSNSRSARAKEVAREVGLPMIAEAWKPRRKAFRAAMDVLGTSTSETAVIGDQVFTDVLGGNRMNLKTVLVVPISDKELWTTRLLRRLERRILRKIK
jgi:HAD superfamily phosphatase (TIGR01668 family)